MNQVVNLTCRECGTTREYNFIKGYIYGWPHCNGHRRMVVTEPVPEELKRAAESECYLTDSQRANVYVDPPSTSTTTWKLKSPSKSMK